MAYDQSGRVLNPSRVVAALAGLAGGWLLGCALGHDALPTDACRSSRDCFVAQGEVCDMKIGRCVVPDKDGGPPDGRPDDAAVADAPNTGDAR